jgi:hypothetical protein
MTSRKGLIGWLVWSPPTRAPGARPSSGLTAELNHFDYATTSVVQEIGVVHLRWPRWPVFSDEL